jgi:hypothetical protein
MPQTRTQTTSCAYDYLPGDDAYVPALRSQAETTRAARDGLRTELGC